MEKRFPLEEIIIFGSCGHAKVVADIVEKEAKYRIAAFFDDVNIQRNHLYSHSIIHDLENLRKLNIHYGLIAIGHNWLRESFVEKIKAFDPEFRFVTVVHPSVNIGKNVLIGNGTVIMAGVSINSDSVIHDHCIINTNASLDHDNVVEHFAQIAPGVTIGGNVHVGTMTFVGLGTSVIQKITIGRESFIGAGSTVCSNIPNNVLACGAPCKIVRTYDVKEKKV